MFSFGRGSVRYRFEADDGEPVTVTFPNAIYVPQLAKDRLCPFNKYTAKLAAHFDDGNCRLTIKEIGANVPIDNSGKLPTVAVMPLDNENGLDADEVIRAAILKAQAQVESQRNLNEQAHAIIYTVDTAF